MPGVLNTAGKRNRQRACRTKVKTGCRTCKKRRVKCDETKPQCTRCLEYGADCGGYEETTWKFIATKPLPGARLSIFVHVPPLARGAPSTGIRFQDGKDHRYFRFFQTELAREFEVGFDTSLWDRIVLQSCAVAPILRLTVALAALKRSERADGQRAETRSHKQYAFEQYGKGLRELRDILEDKNRYSLRTTLVAALLIFCFERILGDTVQAVSNVNGAITLMARELTPKYRPDAKGIYPDSQLEEQLLIVFRRLARPTVTAFGKMKDDQSLDRETPNIDFVSTLFKSEIEIPETFSSLDEARCNLEEIRYSANPPPGIFNTDDAEVSCMSSHSRTILPTPPELILMGQMERWNLAFLPHFERAQTEATTFISATTVAVWALTIELLLCWHGWNTPSLLVDRVHSLRGAKFLNPYPKSFGYKTGSSTQDRQLAIIRTIVWLCRRLVDHPNYPKTFVCGLGIIPPLFSILMGCKDQFLKLEALQILKDLQPRVENVWDSRAVVEAWEKSLKAADRYVEIPMYAKYQIKASGIAVIDMSEAGRSLYEIGAPSENGRHKTFVKS